MTGTSAASAATASSPDTIPGWRLAAFSSLAIPVYAASQPLNVYLPAILTQHYGLSLASIGLIFLFERLWGAVADPLIGILSDRTRSRFGARRTWIAAGSVLFALASMALFFPPVAVTIPYLTVTLFVFYTAWAMIQIPYLAWSGEIAAGYHERTRVQTFAHVAGASSLLLVLILPTILDQIRPGDIVAKQSAFGAFILIGLAVTLPLALRAFPDVPRSTVRHKPVGLRQSLSLIVREKLLVKIVLPLVAWLGFDPKGVNTPEALSGLLLVFALGPAFAHAASALLIARFTLDETTHSAIRRQLDATDSALVPSE